MAMNKDQVEGKIKEAAGILTDDEKLQKEGKADQLAGDVKGVMHNVADKADEVIDDIKHAVEKD
jgi:uncharacterized protein YjbJ (UPF0337 family)